MTALRKKFMERINGTPSVLNEQCLYFEGYCGEHNSQYPDITQYNGAMRITVGGSGTIGTSESNI